MNSKKHRRMDDFGQTRRTPLFDTENPPRIKPRTAASPLKSSKPNTPIAQQRKTQDRVSKSSVQDSKNSKDVNISIKLSVPTSLPKSLKRVKGKIKKASRPVKSAKVANSLLDRVKPLIGKRVLMVFIALALLLGGWQGVAKILENKRRQRDISQVQGAQTAVEKPQFEAALPEGNDKVTPRYDAQRKVISFNDNIGGIPITVSQQQLPETFKTDPTGNVERIAKGFNANEPLEAGDIKGFVGKSANGPQSVIFQKDGKLIFIFINKELPKTLIADYIKTLK